MTCHFDKWHRWHSGGTTPSKGVHSRFTLGVEGIFTQDVVSKSAIPKSKGLSVYHHFPQQNGRGYLLCCWDIPFPLVHHGVIKPGSQQLLLTHRNSWQRMDLPLSSHSEPWLITTIFGDFWHCLSIGYIYIYPPLYTPKSYDDHHGFSWFLIIFHHFNSFFQWKCQPLASRIGSWHLFGLFTVESCWIPNQLRGKNHGKNHDKNHGKNHGFPPFIQWKLEPKKGLICLDLDSAAGAWPAWLLAAASSLRLSERARFEARWPVFFLGTDWPVPLPSGKQPHNYGKSPFTVKFPMINGDFP